MKHYYFHWLPLIVIVCFLFYGCNIENTPQETDFRKYFIGTYALSGDISAIYVVNQSSGNTTKEYKDHFSNKTLTIKSDPYSDKLIVEGYYLKTTATAKSKTMLVFDDAKDAFYEDGYYITDEESHIGGTLKNNTLSWQTVSNITKTNFKTTLYINSVVENTAIKK